MATAGIFGSPKQTGQPAWASPTWKAPKAKTYGVNKYPTTPAPISGEQIASFQDQIADANAGVRQAMAELTAGKNSSLIWQKAQQRSIGNAVGDAYTSQMAAAGSAGTGRMALQQSNLKSALVEQELSQRGQIAQQKAEKDAALMRVLEQARAKQALTTDAVNRRKALLGADVAQLIRGGKG